MTDHTDSAETWSVKINADTSALETHLKTATELGKKFGTVLTTAFEGITLKGQSASDVLRTLALNVSSLVLKTALKPLNEGLGSLFSGLLSGTSAFAKGAAFQQGLPVPFASGGIIQTPTAFPLTNGRTGIAGERGAEAILPLSRGPDGRLGVAFSGSGKAINVTFNVTAADTESFRRSEGQITAMLSRAVARGQRNL